MGTSKRNLNKKIKKLLQDKPLNDIDTSALEVSKTIITRRELNQQLVDEETIQNFFSIISKNFSKLSSAGFGGKSKKEVLEDPLTMQEFLNMILDQIEDDEFFEKELLEKAYKISMTKMLQEDEFDLYSFAQVLFYHLIQLILEKELYDTLRDLYEDFTYQDIEKWISRLTNQIMNDSIYKLVDEFVDKKLPLKKVLDKIVEETKNSSFGEF